MRQCPHATACPIFPLFTMQDSLRVWQTMYCEAEFERCARYQLSRDGKPVPLMLLPNGKTLTGPARRPSDPPSSR